MKKLIFLLFFAGCSPLIAQQGNERYHVVTYYHINGQRQIPKKETKSFTDKKDAERYKAGVLTTKKWQHKDEYKIIDSVKIH